MKPYHRSPETISAKELDDLVRAFLGKRVRNLPLHTADTRYCLPNFETAKTIIESSKMKRLAEHGRSGVREETFDCDDFALLLKARFAYAAYREPEKYGNCPNCFGIVWGLLPFPFPHSMNWMITDDREFYFVEPQREAILPLKKCDNFCYFNFMMV